MKRAKLSHSILTIESEIKDIDIHQNFFQKNYEVIEVGQLKGVVFNICNNEPEDPCINTMINGDTLNLRAVLDNTKYGWVVGDKIRIMYLNERDPNLLTRLIPYFEERLRTFHIRERNDVKYIEYKNFTNNWNSTHSDRVDANCIDVAELTPKQTQKDDLLSIE